jgi:hypothetical protein
VLVRQDAAEGEARGAFRQVTGGIVAVRLLAAERHQAEARGRALRRGGEARDRGHAAAKRLGGFGVASGEGHHETAAQGGGRHGRRIGNVAVADGGAARAQRRGQPIAQRRGADPGEERHAPLRRGR